MCTHVRFWVFEWAWFAQLLTQMSADERTLSFFAERNPERDIVKQAQSLLEEQYV